MKNTFYCLAFSFLTACTLFMSCGPNKKILAYKARIEQLKKDSIETHRKMTDITISKVTVPKNEVIVIPEIKSVPSPSKNEELATFPPTYIATTFKTNYPTALQVAWTNEVLMSKIHCYKVSFLELKNKNSVIYAENGEILETRVQILPEQLPQNVYNAIIKKYPNVLVVYATTFKNSKIEGSYAANIKLEKQPEELEIILTENGTFVK